jgi:hypothetical protein
VIGGVGVAALAVGGSFGLMALASDSDAKEACAHRRTGCSDEALELEKERDSRALISTIGVATGLVGIGISSVLLLTAPTPTHRSASGPRLRLQFGPRMAVISGTSEF